MSDHRPWSEVRRRLDSAGATRIAALRARMDEVELLRASTIDTVAAGLETTHRRAEMLIDALEDLSPGDRRVVATYLSALDEQPTFEPMPRTTDRDA